MASQGSSSEKVKRTLLIGLGVVFAALLVYQLFLKGPAPRSKLTAQPNAPSATPTTTASAPATPQARQVGVAAQQEAQIQQLLSDMTPLNVSLISRTRNGDAKAGPRGNIFAYYVEPPKPPPPPPAPPPIQLIGVQPQTAVAGTPRPITLVVTGNKIPADAQILFDGAPRPTKRVSEAQLSTEITAQEYGFARNISISVKSKSDPTQNSNPLAFVVQPAPEPQFVYKGRLGTLGQAQYNYAVVELNSTKEIKRVKVGETIMGIWRVDAISGDAIDITNTQYDIKRRVPLQDKTR
ncbi:MAG TPA: hypothetical protein VGL29_11290 [Blastocatellia bacterium]